MLENDIFKIVKKMKDSTSNGGILFEIQINTGQASTFLLSTYTIIFLKLFFQSNSKSTNKYILELGQNTKTVSKEFMETNKSPTKIISTNHLPKLYRKRLHK